MRAGEHVVIGDPAHAPARADLTFLRRRARPRPAAAAPPAPAARPGGVDYTHRDQRSAPATGPATNRPKIDFTRPDRRRATVPPAAPSTPPPVTSRPAAARPPATTTLSSGLDLTHPRRGSDGGLDLSRPAPPARPRRPPLSPPRVHADRRIAAGEQVLLNVRSPSVTLTRVQSGLGQLRIEAVCSPEVGDLRLGAVYQLRSGGTSTVQHAGGHRFAPTSRRPVIVAGREEYEEIGIDLRQVGDLERLSVYAFSESRATLRWGGTLVVTTTGGGRIEVPLETLYEGPIAVLISVLNLDGELVVRAEMESIAGDVREAARAYGYDRIPWRDERVPVD